MPSILFQHHERSEKKFVHLIQHLHYMNGRFFPAVPRCDAVNVAVLYFGRTFKYGFRAQVRVVIHIGPRGQWSEGMSFLSLTLSRESGSRATVTLFPFLIYTSPRTPN